VAALDGVFRLLHPIMPFLTEALWLRLPAPSGLSREESLMIARWPEADGQLNDRAAETQMSALIELIGTVRALRNEYKVPVSASVEIHLGNVAEALTSALQSERQALERLARVSAVQPAGNGSRGPGAHAVLRSGTELFLPLAGLIDVDRERARLREELERLDTQLHAAETRLANEKFVSRAPQEIIEREREKARSFRDQRDRLSAKLEALE
jgi:valyl-tRNA synthetase